MDILKENLTKFIDSIIVEDYSKAHKFLEVVINEKVKGRIKKAAKKNPFVTGAEKSAKESAFGKKGMQQAKNPNKKKNVVRESLSQLVKLKDELPDGSNALSALFHFKDYYDGQWSAMYKVMSSGRIPSDEIPDLKREVFQAMKLAQKQGELEAADDFEQLLKELNKIEQKYIPSEENI